MHEAHSCRQQQLLNIMPGFPAPLSIAVALQLVPCCSHAAPTAVCWTGHGELLSGELWRSPPAKDLLLSWDRARTSCQCCMPHAAAEARKPLVHHWMHGKTPQVPLALVTASTTEGRLLHNCTGCSCSPAGRGLSITLSFLIHGQPCFPHHAPTLQEFQLNVHANVPDQRDCVGNQGIPGPASDLSNILPGDLLIGYGF